MLDISYESMLDQTAMVKRSLVGIAASQAHRAAGPAAQHTVEHLDDAARPRSRRQARPGPEALNRKAGAQRRIAGFGARRES